MNFLLQKISFPKIEVADTIDHYKFNGIKTASIPLSLELSYPVVVGTSAVHLSDPQLKSWESSLLLDPKLSQVTRNCNAAPLSSKGTDIFLSNLAYRKKCWSFHKSKTLFTRKLQIIAVSIFANSMSCSLDAATKYWSFSRASSLQLAMKLTVTLVFVFVSFCHAFDVDKALKATSHIQALSGVGKSKCPFRDVIVLKRILVPGQQTGTKGE